MVPNELRYTAEHEWVRITDEGLAELSNQSGLGLCSINWIDPVDDVVLRGLTVFTSQSP